MSGAGFAERVAARMEPELYAEVITPTVDPQRVQLWAEHVREVVRTLRCAVLVGAGAPAELATLLAVTGQSEGDLLVAVAEHHGRPDVAELLETYLAALRAVGDDGSPLLEDPTGVHAVVIHLTDRSPRTRRTS